MESINRILVRAKSGLWFAPATILVLLVFVYPIFRTLGLSFTHLNLGTGFQPRFAGADNFVRLIADSRFLNSLHVTALFTAASVALEFSIGLMSALAVEKIKQGSKTARTLLLIPWTLPTAIIALLWMWIFNDQYGFINAILLRTGIIDSPIAWLGGPQTALFSITMADVWKAFPFVYIVLFAGLQSIPREMYEAMEIDGGTAWHKFRYVTLPHLSPFIFLALIFRIVQAFAVFDLVYVLTGGGPGGATETVSVYGYYTFMRYLDFGYGATLVVAIVIVLALLAGILYSVLLRKYEMAR
jgi:multiple sugar transport system permease protein